MQTAPQQITSMSVSTTNDPDMVKYNQELEAFKNSPERQRCSQISTATCLLGCLLYGAGIPVAITQSPTWISGIPFGAGVASHCLSVYAHSKAAPPVHPDDQVARGSD